MRICLAIFCCFSAVSLYAQDMWADLEGKSSVPLSSMVQMAASSSFQASSPVLSSSSAALLPALSAVLVSGPPSPVPQPSSPLVVAENSPAQAPPARVIVSSSSSSPSSSSMSSSSARSRKDLLGPVRVSRVRAIDEMKGKYKSPRKALFLSLALPGAGQIYVGGTTANIARGIAYLATEAVLGGLWYHYSVTLYGQQVTKYETFARKNYSIGKYETGVFSIFTGLSNRNKEIQFAGLYLSDRSDYCNAIYGSNQNHCADTTLTTGAAHRDAFAEDSSLGESIQRNGGFWDEQTFFRIIGGNNYVLGWDDVDSVRTASDLQLIPPVSWAPLGASKSHLEYLAMRQKANDYANYQAYFLGGILLNHIVSAVDATISAYAHNKGLYEEKVTLMERVHFDSYVDFGGVVSGAVRARLEF